jgi:serine/threonine protein kinase
MSSNDSKDGEMKLSNFEIIRTLGKGSFGSVKYAKSKIDGQFYAVKYMKKHDIIKMKQGIRMVFMPACILL